MEEEEMIRLAIEASKNEEDKRMANLQLTQQQISASSGNHDEMKDKLTLME